LRVRDDSIIRRVNEVPGIPEETDLTVRAAHLLQQSASHRRGVDILVEKQLPQGGGLGGGSSDAATVLLALNRLWQLEYPRARLLELALRLGADVPVFVNGENALVEGIGEVLTPLAVPADWYVVLVPPVQVSTAAAFASPELKRDSKIIRIQSFSVDLAVNDLERPVCLAFAEVERYLQWLRRFGPAMMTGSGACVFAAFGSEHAARSVLAQLPDNAKGFITRGLEQHPLRDMAR
jgi:4-diphosphocytidyl-2-C-methyl-D-erythritol kinase